VTLPETRGQQPTSRLRETVLGVAVAVGFIASMEPAGTWGTYSQLEVALAVLAIAACASIGATPRTAPLIPIPLVLLLGLMGASALWSFASWETLRDTATYVIFAAAAWVIVRNTRLTTVVIAIVGAGGAILLASLGLLLIDPDAALWYQSSGLQGIYANRNTFGVVMVMVVPATLALPAVTVRGKLSKFSLVVLFSVAAAFSLSKTAMAVIALVLIIWLALHLARRSVWYPIAIGVVLFVGVIVAAANVSKVLDVLGKDATINGRLDIWAGVLRVVPESPIIGFGWTRSWPLGSPHSNAVAESFEGNIVFHAHNEVLNWLVTVGVLGVVLVVTLYGLACWAGTRAFWRGGEPALIWLPLAAVTIVARGLSEISETNAQGWFTLMLILFACGRYLPEPIGPKRPGSLFIRVVAPDRTRQQTLRMELV
jgi:exopolysaccharide production protein ExoQ